MAKPIATSKSKTLRPGEGIQLSELFSYFDPDPGDFVSTFAVQDVTVGGGYFFWGSRLPEGKLSDTFSISSIDNVTFVASTTLGTETIRFIAYDELGHASAPVTAIVKTAAPPPSPGHPVMTARIQELSSFWGSVYVSGRYAYVADTDEPHAGLHIVDVANPHKPLVVGSLTGIRPISVVVRGNFAYVTDPDVGLAVLDISDPSHPKLLGSVVQNDSSMRGFTLAMSGKYLYLPDIMSGVLNIIDPTNPYKPVVVSSYSFGSTAELYVVAAAGKYAYVGVNESGRSGSGSLYVIDITNPLAPTFASKLLIPMSYITSIEIVGRYAYLADDSNGLNIVDISNPVAISLVGSVHHGLMHGRGVQVIGRYAYVSGTRDIGVDKSETGLFVIDVKNPAAPTIVDFYETGGASGTNSGKIAELDGLLYVSNGNSGLEIFDTGTGHRSSLSIMSLDSDKNEGNSGSTPFTFKVIRTGDITKATTVRWAVTVGPDPTANRLDFDGGKLPFGIVSFAAGSPDSSVVTVAVQGDTGIESAALAETFTVSLSNPTGGATIDPLHASASAYIHDDDLVPLLAQLSSLAYEPVFPTGLIPGFRPLTHSDLPSIPLIATSGPSLGRGVYGNANAAALVGVTKDALFVAFRGTDTDVNGVMDPLDKLDWFNMARHFLRFTDLISATDAYVATHPNIKHIYVTGHSMGASMAQAYMSQAQHSSFMYRSVTFANPGYRVPGEAIDDQRITNIHIQGDVVNRVRDFKLKAYQERGTNVTFYDSNKTTSASAVQLHDIGVYQAAVAGASNIGYSLLASGGKNVLGDIVYDIQTDSGHPAWRFLHAAGGIPGTKGADIVIAGSGNDTLGGREGDDVLTGGAGKDVFSFEAGFGKDVITDFIPGLDKIKFAAGIFPDFSTMAGQMVTDGQGGTIVRYSGSDTLTLQHILPTHLRAADFKFG